MARAGRSFIALLFFALILLGISAWQGEKAAAQSPERQTTIVVPYTEYEWWMLRWSDTEILCRILVDHEGLPEADEVILYCGEDLYELWRDTPSCNAKDGIVTRCEGVYLHLVAAQDKEKEVTVQLPPATVYVNLEGCNPTPPENICSDIPNLLFTGEEPLPNERITAIRGTYNGNPFLCESDICSLPLQPTRTEGVTVEFWAESSYGDESEHYIAHVRVLDTGVTEEPGGGGWFVDVISSQWRGEQIASCARIWAAFPPIGKPPEWLSTPESSELLATDEPFYYLAGRLISQGQISADQCSSGGLLPNGYADACGLESARPLVEEWQNRFDQRILDVAGESRIPAQLMKNLFAQESQFWPGVFRVPYEYGLGQLTDNGADSLLLWNDSFFEQFCPLVLAEDACAGGYLHLAPGDQAILRGALALQVKADCPSCLTGIDLTNVDFSVSLFAETLQANCEQVGQIVHTATTMTAGEVANYENLWRFTIANYHAGPGCLAYAINTAWERTGVLTWEEVAPRFTEPCQGVVPYVDKITNFNSLEELAAQSTP